MQYLTACRWLLLAAMIAICGCNDRPAATQQREYALFFHEGVCLLYTRVMPNPVEVRYVMPSGYTWEEYRDDNPTTKVGDTISIDLWLAGRDPGVDYIGFSASNATGILMNTIAVCEDDGPAEVEVIPGFVLHRRVVPSSASTAAGSAPGAVTSHGATVHHEALPSADAGASSG